MEKATFGAGCFWGVEAAFRQIPGVTATTAGYSGGSFLNPTYKDVCTDRTGHAEVVQVEFDPNQVSYSQLLDVFWQSHDPTQLNRQGWDIGTQYRSAIFFHDAEQEAAARASKEAIQRRSRKPVVTEIAALGSFQPVDDSQQNYAARHPTDPYIVVNDAPKLEALRRRFPRLYRH